MTIEDPSIIDLVTEHPELGYVSLIMIEENGWDDRDTRLRQLQEKVTAYLAYALDGKLAQDYPDLATKRVRIQLDCVNTPPTYVRRATRRIAQACQQHGIEFVINQLQQTS